MINAQLDISIHTDRLRKIAIAKGFEIPDGQGVCCFKVTTPNFHELELASRKHRWPKMRKLQADFFNAFMEEATEQEIEILNILALPDIETVRQAEFTDVDDVGETGKFRYTLMMNEELDRVFYEWREELLGTEAVKTVDPMSATYPFHQLSAFSIGTDQVFRDALRELPDYVDSEELKRRRIQAALDNPYLRAVIRDGGNRIKEELGKKHIRLIKIALREKAKEGQNPLQVARWLHKEVGEGKAWYWRRLARSESVLAADAAFESSIRQYQIPYERWSAAPTACPICMQFQGRVWSAGRGPHPVSDTHPHCLCVRRVVYVTDKPIQRPWQRESPYSRLYTREELENIEWRI